jgi:hypothetical protein
MHTDLAVDRLQIVLRTSIYIRHTVRRNVSRDRDVIVNKVDGFRFQQTSGTNMAAEGTRQNTKSFFSRGSLLGA